MACSVWVRVLKTVRQTSSDLIVSKNVSAMALLQRFAVPGMEVGMRWQLQLGLVVHGPALAGAVRVLDQPLGWTPHDESCAHGGERQVAVQPVADGPAHEPADDTPGEQGDGHRQIEPSVPCPDRRDVHAPCLVGRRRRDVLIVSAGVVEIRNS